MIQSLRTLKLGLMADIIDFCTSEKPLRILASLGDDLFGCGRFDTFTRYREAFRYCARIHGFSLKDDKVTPFRVMLTSTIWVSTSSMGSRV